MVKRLRNSLRVARAVILTDLHLRSDYMPGYLDMQVETFTRLVNTKPPDTVIINGDIFHRRNPKGAELLAFRRLLEGFKTKEILINRGNHDTIAKDGSTETTLSLFSDIATIFSETTTHRIGSVDFDFIPHYEDESKIIQDLRGSTNHVFGHWGFDGCVANGSYEYESYVKRSHIGNRRLCFLGHIHKPKIYGKNIFVLGTAHSTSFGEANAQKYIHELLVRDGVVEVVRKPIDFGIRHVTCTLDSLEDYSKRFRFDSFFTILRLKLDTLDTAVEKELYEQIGKKYPIQHLEISFEDVLHKYDSNHETSERVFTLDDAVVGDYIDASESPFSKAELMSMLDEIKSHEN